MENFKDSGGYWKLSRDEGYLDICWVQEPFSLLFGLGKVYHYFTPPTPLLANSRDHYANLMTTEQS